MLSPAPSADRNLVFGLLALQMDFLTSAQLLDALHAWMLRKTTPVGEILRERGLLNGRRLELLEAIVEEHIAQHGGDAQASLAALRVEESVRADFHRLDDADVQASLVALASTPPETSARKSRPAMSEGPADSLATSAPTMAAPPGSRFRRLREHARGGLGEVFVALDEELHREVALKEIQDRFADQDEARSRFLREAEITGNLEHPGIVPVYGLGTYYDGRPYYAMRFIRGQSMQDALARFHKSDEDSQRDPGERSLALRELLTRFVAVCNAMAYAHNRGVIHRDIKPANVMLGEFGETLVVDWGLARLLERHDSEQTSVERPISSFSASATAPTQMGQVIGTATFMPPEQAEGRHDREDIASDVFSLGATLYAVLTGQPPYQGADVLGQARRAEVTPARQRKRSVPAALEAVCARAMARRPEDRYPSARALAEEVERWLADEPVQAYRESLADRLRRWGRRNRSLVSTAVVLLAAGVVALSAGLWAVGREQQRTKEALERAQKAEKETLDQFRASTSDAIEQLIGSTPGRSAQEKKYLERTLKRWQAFADRAGDDERSRAIRAEGHFRVALLQDRLGRTEEALPGYRQALTIRQKLVDDFPAVPEYRKDLAYTHANLGVVLAEKIEWKEAMEHYDKALAIKQKLAGEFPDVHDYQSDLASTHNNLGALLVAQNQLAKAAEQYEKALVIQRKLAEQFPNEPDYRKDLAGMHSNMGNLLKRQNQWVKAKEQYDEALAIRQKLAHDFPDVPDYRRYLAGSHNNLAIALAGLNQLDRAAEHYRKALVVHKKLADEFPGVPAYRKDLAATHNNLGVFLMGQKQWEEAGRHYDQALIIQQRLADEFTALPTYRKDLANTHNNLGRLFHNQRQWEKSAEQYRKALAIREKLAAGFPAVPEYQIDLAEACYYLGRLFRVSGKPAEGLPWLDKAISKVSLVHKRDPHITTHRQLMRNAHMNRAAAYDHLEKPAEAVKDWTRAIDLSPVPEQPSLRSHRVNSLVRAGSVPEAVAEVAELTKAGKWPRTVWYDFACAYAVASGRDAGRKKEYADRAMELLRQAVKAGYANAAHMAKDTDLNALRDREDFKKLLAEVEALAGAKKSKPSSSR
jgi:serine/threonine-protein kinase